MATAAATSALVLTATASAVSGTSHPSPPYLNAQTSLAVLYSNDHWNANSHQARQFTATGNLPDQTYKQAGGDVAKWMWANTCPSGRQRVDFHRVAWLPGPPDDLQLGVNGTVLSHHGASWGNPFRSVTLVINGNVVDKATTQLTNHPEVSDDVSGDALRAGDFHPGKNSIDVIVVKRANPSYIEDCSSAPTRLGLGLALVFDGFDNDLGVRKPDSSTPSAVRIAPGDKSPVFLKFTVTNYGPSASRSGTFAFLVQPGFLVMESDPDSAPYFTSPVPIAVNSTGPLTSCVSPSPRQVTCRYDDWWQPGQQATVAIGFHVAAPTDQASNDVEDMDLQWRITPDPDQIDRNGTNDYRSFDVYYCYPQATDPRCAGATSSGL